MSDGLVQDRRFGSLGGAAIGRRRVVARHFDQRSEGSRIRDREVSQDLAIDIDTGGLQAGDETVVRHSLSSSRGVDPLDPELSEFAFACPTVTVGVDERVRDLLLGLAVEPRALPPIAGGLLQDIPALLVCVDRALDACHVLLLVSEADCGQARLPSSRRALLASPGASTASPSRRRVRVLGLCSFRCILPALRCMILPVPVNRNRFLAPECVFIFGICATPYRLVVLATSLTADHPDGCVGS